MVLGPAATDPVLTADPSKVLCFCATGPLGYEPHVMLGSWTNSPVLDPPRCSAFATKSSLRGKAVKLRTFNGSSPLGCWASAGPVLDPSRCCSLVLQDPPRCGALWVRASISLHMVLNTWANGPVLSSMRCCAFVLKGSARCGALGLRVSRDARPLGY